MDERELAAQTRRAIKEAGDRRIQIVLEAACELCLDQFGTKETIRRLEGQITFLKEFI